MTGNTETLDVVKYAERWVQAMPLPVMVTDGDNHAVYFNDAWLQYRGTSIEDELVGKWQDAVHPEDLKNIDISKLAGQNGAVDEMRVRLKSASGQFRWTRFSASPIPQQDGLFGGYIYCCSDIQDLVASEEQHTRFFEIASDILMTTKGDGFIGKINDACERVLGWTADEIVKIKFTDLIHPDDIAATYALREPMRRGEEITDFENRYRHKDGTYRWLSWRYRYEPGDKIIYACAVDISQRKAYERELEETIKRFNLAMDASSEAVWDYDIVKKELYVSRRYAEMLGYSPADAPQSADGWAALCHPDDFPAAMEAQQAYLKGQCTEYRLTARMRHKNGEWRRLLSRAVALRDSAGEPIRLIGIHADITEQQETEDSLRRLKDQAESANRAKTDFLANMSHEIRTPMNAVIGAAHILNFGSLSEEKRKAVTGVLMQGANSMMELINDLLDLSKIEAGSLHLEHAEFDARELVAEIVKMLEVQATGKGLSLQLQNRCACVDDRLFIGDRLRIRQILVNLCSNAVKFTENGTVTVAIDCHPTSSAEVEELRFVISDTGVGIPSEKLDLIFGKFEQADASVGRRYGGSGLGLAIAKSLAEAMRGSISAESEVGIGSTFIVRLPLARGATTGSPSKQSSLENTRPTTYRPVVLLVEDNPGNILVATHFLEDFGFGFHVATSGEDALKTIKAGAAYPIILMDIQMPGLDGRETTRLIRAFEQDEGRAPCQIIAMTAHAMLADREKCLAAGMNDYITKPFDPEVLNAKLKSAAAASALKSA